jgi:K+-transporting ATPase ATPase C chain
MAIKVLFIMTLLTGIIYPLVMTGIAQLSYPHKANGSLVMKDNKLIGSELLGQNSDSSIYFSSRPSAIGYNPIPSGATNYGPTSDTLKKLVNARHILFAEQNSLPNSTEVPKEMIFASGSGLDPHISPEAALLQVERISNARKFDQNQKQELLDDIKNMTEGPQFFIFGERRINVFALNVKLDSYSSQMTDHAPILGIK